MDGRVGVELKWLAPIVFFVGMCSEFFSWVPSSRLTLAREAHIDTF